MNAPEPEQDPWDRIHDCDRDEPKPKQGFTTGEAITGAIIIVTVLCFAAYSVYYTVCRCIGLEP